MDNQKTVAEESKIKNDLKMESDSFEVKHKGIVKGEPPAQCIIVIFGASGDLTHRELIPSLFSLNCLNLLPKNYAIIGFARRDYSDESFRNEMKNATKKNTGCKEDQWNKFAANLHYIRGDFNDLKSPGYKDLSEKIMKLQEELKVDDNVLFHLATPPESYGLIIKGLSESSLAKGKSGWRRIIIEKPFGSDEKSANELDHEIHKVFQEEQIFRVDHFLGKETVQNMLVFRFANPGFEPIWNRNYIDNVQITVAEEIGIGTRGNFYEKTGILRDMVQNHLLQLLCMTAIEPPVHFNANALRMETWQVLESICKINIEKDTVLGQYGKGIIDGKEVSGYREENNVSEGSATPTFAALKLTLDNWRWSGVPFYLRTGKRLKKKITEVSIKFKPTPHLMFPVDGQKKLNPGSVVFRLQPNEGIIYTFIAKQPGAELKLQPVNLNFEYASAFGIDEPPSAYQWLLFDAMKGDQTLFPKSDWITKAWSILDPIIKKWEEKPWAQLPNYEAGSWGPAEAAELLQRDNSDWNLV